MAAVLRALLVPGAIQGKAQHNPAAEENLTTMVLVTAQTS
jgi:hypothetical protein